MFLSDFKAFKAFKMMMEEEIEEAAEEMEEEEREGIRDKCFKRVLLKERPKSMMMGRREC
jgi:uncharacterized protein with ParB-like and HNH nuclease domain